MINQHKPLIIEQPKLQSPAQRIGYFVLTIMLWIFWIYLWLPLLVTWEKELNISWLIDHHWFTREEYQFILSMITVVAMASVIISIAMGLWAYYNLRRFRTNRRKRPDILDSGKLADFFLVDAKQIEVWQHAKRLQVGYLENGKLDKIDVIEHGPQEKLQLSLLPVHDPK